MKKRILLFTIIGTSFSLFAQNEIVNGLLTVNGSIIAKKNQTSTFNYPSLTSRGDIFQLYKNVNNTLEIGVGGKSNTRRSWILSRHSDISGSYGKYYSTLHLQPDTGNKTQYKGIAIGFNPSSHVSTGTHLAVNGNVGIGTTNPLAKLTLFGTNSEGWESGIELKREDGGNGKIVVDSQGMKLRTIQHGDGFYFRNAANATSMYISDNLNVAIYGKLETKEVKVTLTPTADFVFKNDYKLPSLNSVEKHIKQKKHLPEIASAKEMKKNGVNIGEFQIQLLQKIEELTLYTIAQEKKIEKVEKENESLKFLATKYLELQIRLEKLEKE
ncbi:hypothetical protein [Tenacibaculum soleae]|uniref:hypothetical protein n=1 Tax=Tenacibaculum soleae TaxID=447689 RepID=UPI0026E2076D|nr:hypothetical protein [Tenacibaculum soleae]MDO6814064.1 hypothetical protein [Tenacibaculum soleae]